MKRSGSTIYLKAIIRVSKSGVRPLLVRIARCALPKLQRIPIRLLPIRQIQALVAIVSSGDIYPDLGILPGTLSIPRLGRGTIFTSVGIRLENDFGTADDVVVGVADTAWHVECPGGTVGGVGRAWSTGQEPLLGSRAIAVVTVKRSVFISRRKGGERDAHINSSSRHELPTENTDTFGRVAVGMDVVHRRRALQQLGWCC